MCVAIPMQIVSIDGETAIAEIDGVVREASLALLEEAPAVGDYVIVHAGFVISHLDPEDAEQTLALLREALEMGEMQ